MEDIGKLLKNIRESKKISLYKLAEKTGLHRTSISKIENGSRNPTVENASKIAEALGKDLGIIIMKKNVVSQRLNSQYIRNIDDNINGDGIDYNLVVNAVNHCYEILAIIDNELIMSGSEQLAQLVEKANLSSIIGNIIGKGIEINSKNRFYRNRPHTYPDLLSRNESLYPNFEIKVALDKNSPKGHLAKKGNYMTFRYIIESSTLVKIWEIKFGYLDYEDFSSSNTPGDSGKTAVIKPSSLNNLTCIYYDPDISPYKRYKGLN